MEENQLSLETTSEPSAEPRPVFVPSISLRPAGLDRIRAVHFDLFSSRHILDVEPDDCIRDLLALDVDRARVRLRA